MDTSNASRRPLCVNRCGFYGSEETKNMCSKCYDHLLKTQLIDQTVKALDKLSLSDRKPSNPSVSSSVLDEATNALDRLSLFDTRPSNVSTCKKCNKKVGLIGFKCRCGDLFCGKHRYATEHSCMFDYKKFDREILIKQNHLISADKLAQRIR